VCEPANRNFPGGGVLGNQNARDDQWKVGKNTLKIPMTKNSLTLNNASKPNLAKKEFQKIK